MLTLPSPAWWKLISEAYSNIRLAFSLHPILVFKIRILTIALQFIAVGILLNVFLFQTQKGIFKKCSLLILITEIKDNTDSMSIDCDMFYMELCTKFTTDFYRNHS